MMAITLRDYQRQACDAYYEYLNNGGRAGLITMATGLGKSLIIATVCKELIQKYPDVRILSIVHTRELIAQNFKELMRLWPFAPAGINSAGLNRRDWRSQILFAGIQSIHRHVRAIGHVDLVIIDECFAGGTLIDTPTGRKPIEQIREGEPVFNALGSGKVLATSKRENSDLWEVRLSNGTVVKCTGSHPFFTERGWLPARLLEKGRRLFSREDLSSLQENIQAASVSELHSKTGRMEKGSLLFNILLEERRKCDVGERSERENASHSEGDRTQTDSKRRERSRPNKNTKDVGGSLRARLENRVCDTYEDKKGERVSNLLQAGPGEPGLNVGNRAGRRFPRFAVTQRTGSEEGWTSEGVRVESVSRAKSGSAETVYNLQVEGHPSYYAEGVLVHNCHLTPKGSVGTYNKVLNELRLITPDMAVLGLTATDFRLDSGNLVEGEDRLFDQIVYKYGIKEGIRDGWLSPLFSKAMAAEIDTKGVTIRGGEFVAPELERAAMSGDNVERAVSEIIQWGKDRQAWLVFCSGIKHAEAVNNELQSHGVASEIITGKTGHKERDSSIRKFKAGELRCLVNVNVLTTGFNVPGVDLIALLRPTKSAGLAVQQIGRGTRLSEGKTNCLILDFAAILKTHGPVDEMTGREKSKRKGKEKPRFSLKICPECNGIEPIFATVCQQCGFVWVKEEKEPTHSGSADGTSVVVSIEAKPEWWKPRAWRFSIYQKEGKPPCLRIKYIFGLATVVNEFLHFELPGWPAKKAAARWAELAGPFGFVPQTTQEAFERQSNLILPSQVCVRKDGNFMNVIKTVRLQNAA